MSEAICKLNEIEALVDEMVTASKADTLTAVANIQRGRSIEVLAKLAKHLCGEVAELLTADAKPKRSKKKEC